MSRNELASVRLLPDSVFGRLLLIVLASVGAPHAVALLIAPQAHRSSLLGALLMLIPPMGLGVYFAARSITRPLARLKAEADCLGRGKDSGLAAHGTLDTPDTPREMRTLCMAFDLAHGRVQNFVSNRSRALAAVSHDLKGPLTRMRLRIETLEDETSRTKLERDLEDLSGLVRSAIALLKDLEDGERVEAIDINALIERLQSEYAEMGRPVSVSGRARQPCPEKCTMLGLCLRTPPMTSVRRVHD